MEFKGTKGEWELELDKALYFKIKVSPDLHVEIYDSEETKSGILEANAQLIASAPELLEALIELTDLMDDVLSGEYTPDTFTTQLAKQSIAKALGNESK